MANNPLQFAISLARRAGKLVMGFDPVKESVLNGKAVLVLTTADLSPKTYKRVAQFCEDWVELAQMPLTQDELTPIAGKPVGVFSIIDPNMATLCRKQLNQCNTMKQEEMSE